MMPCVWREVKTTLTSLITIILHFVTPLFLLVFFATVLGRNLVSFSYNGATVGYLDFFTPGLVWYTTFMTFQMALLFIRHDRMSGMLGMMVLARGGLGGYITGKLVSQVAINIIKAASLVGLAVVISSGTTAVWRLPNLGLFGLAVLLGSVVWLCLGLAAAMVLKRDDVREILTMLIAMPLTFGSSMYYDITRAPQWIRAISQVNPLTYTCNVAREAYLSPTPTGFDRDLIILAVMAILSLTLAVGVSRKIDY